MGGDVWLVDIRVGNVWVGMSGWGYMGEKGLGGGWLGAWFRVICTSRGWCSELEP